MANETKGKTKNGAISTSSQSVAENSFDPYKIITSPLATEKCIRLIEFNNTLVFRVHSRATKKDVKRAVEELFKVKVRSVNVQNCVQGFKKAYVTLTANFLASDVSADLGFI
jgi:ribosomal protein L23